MRIKADTERSVADPGYEFFPSRIPDPNFSHHGSRIHIKEFKYFNPKKWFLSSRKYGPDCSSRDPDPDFLPIPDPGVKKAPDPKPGSGSATLTERKHWEKGTFKKQMK
jgi:hypothetical protein